MIKIQWYDCKEWSKAFAGWFFCKVRHGFCDRNLRIERDHSPIHQTGERCYGKTDRK